METSIPLARQPTHFGQALSSLHKQGKAHPPSYALLPTQHAHPVCLPGIANAKVGWPAQIMKAGPLC